MLTQFDDSFDQALVAWFASRTGVWSGTAAELLTALRTGLDVRTSSWPQSPLALYAHLESHRQILSSQGVDVRLHHGSPRMLSLRPSQAEKPETTSASTPVGISSSPDQPMNLLPLVDDLKFPVAEFGEGSRKADEIAPLTSTARPDLAGRFVSGRYAEKETSSGRVFENTGEALLAIAAMRDAIREQGFDLKSAIGLVLSRIQSVSRCCGMAVGVLRENAVIYPARTGIGVTMEGLDLSAKFFQSCIGTGGALQLRDAQRHPLFGDTFRAEGVGSLIIVPIFHDGDVSAAMEFIFEDKRSFSTACVIDLELIASVVSECSTFTAQTGLRRTEERGISTGEAETTDVSLGHATDKKGSVDALFVSQEDSNNAGTPLEIGAAPESTVLAGSAAKLGTPSHLGLAVRRVWMRVLKQVAPARYVAQLPDEKASITQFPPLETGLDRLKEIDTESSPDSSK